MGKQYFDQVQIHTILRKFSDESKIYVAMKTFFALLIAFFLDTARGADPKVVIRQTFPYTTKVNGHDTVVIEKDKDCYLGCVVDNRPADKKVQWLVQNAETKTNIPISTDTDTQNTFKYQIDKPAANFWRLKIQNVQPSDQALYICRVQLGGQQNAIDSRIISVIEKPQVIDILTSSDTTVEEGDRVELKCAASGIPTPLVTWQLAGGGILPTGGREYTAPSILIDSVSRTHKGYYKCIAENTAGMDVRRIYLNVKFQPTLVPESQVVFQALGFSRQLYCEASGNPVPTTEQILWFKDGVPLEDQNKYVFENYFGSNYVLMKLTVHNIDDNDFGLYRCYAENSEGNGQNFIELSKSDTYVSGRYHTGGATIVSLSLTTLIMLVVVSLLHFC